MATREEIRLRILELAERLLANNDLDSPEEDPDDPITFADFVAVLSNFVATGNFQGEDEEDTEDE